MKIEIKPYGSADSQYLDITNLIKKNGVTWSFPSVDADGAGRSLDGIMHRKQIAIKNKLEFECVPLTSLQLVTLKRLLENEWLQARITDVAEVVTFKCYRGATMNTAILISHNNKDVWGDFAFSIIEC